MVIASSVLRRTGPVSRMSSVKFASALPSSWGSEPWRYDKDEFLKMVNGAKQNEQSQGGKELGKYLTLAFHQFDYNLDGNINSNEFDWLVEEILLLPRRYGCVKSSVDIYGSEAQRTKARAKIFEDIDRAKGEPNGFITAPQFLQWAKGHFSESVDEWQSASNTNLDFYNLEGITKEQFVQAMTSAIGDRTSKEFAKVYEFLMAIFVEETAGAYGDITFEEFRRILARFFLPARSFGLGPAEMNAEEAKAVFDSLCETRKDMAGDVIGFQALLNWVSDRIAEQVAE